MSISPVGFNPGMPGLSGLTTGLTGLPSLPQQSPVGSPAVSGPAFGDMLAQGLDRLEGLHDSSDNLAVKAATGDLQDVHDYMIASTKASVATETTVAVRNKAIEAFTEIMRMQV
jgi:flagellar hook-basal body complex protein FliE